MEGAFEKWIRQDAVDLGAKRGADSEFGRVGFGGTSGQEHLPVWNRKRVVILRRYQLRHLLLTGLRSIDFEAPVWLNGAPRRPYRRRHCVHAAVSVAVEDHRITHVYVVATPQKLDRLDGITALTPS